MLFSFHSNFFMTLPVWVIRGFQICFVLSSRYKNLVPEKTISSLLSFKKPNIKNAFL